MRLRRLYGNYRHRPHRSNTASVNCWCPITRRRISGRTSVNPFAIGQNACALCAVIRASASITSSKRIGTFTTAGCIESARSGRIVMHVIRPGQREQDIYIQQGGHRRYRRGPRNSRATSASSPAAAAATSSASKRGVPGASWNTGDPFWLLNGVRAASPRLASSDNAAPTETPRAAASALAAARTSFSISSVVRILIQR